MGNAGQAPHRPLTAPARQRSAGPAHPGLAVGARALGGIAGTMVLVPTIWEWLLGVWEAPIQALDPILLGLVLLGVLMVSLARLALLRPMLAGAGLVSIGLVMLIAVVPLLGMLVSATFGRPVLGGWGEITYTRGVLLALVAMTIGSGLLALLSAEWGEQAPS